MFVFINGKKIHLIHDENMHKNVHRNFNRITKSFYIPRFSKKFRRYIKDCLNCQLIQTKEHKPYGELMPITSPFQFFHIIAIDFVFVLLGELNALFNATDNFVRKVVLIPKK